jgi:hypothetical protein
MLNNSWARFAGVRDWPGQSAPAPRMRIPDCGESNRSLQRLRTTAAFGCRALYPCRNLGRNCLAEVACVAKPEIILAWYRRLIARKFDGSKHRSYPGRPRLDPELEAPILRMAQENKGWGYDRIAGALANLGHQLSDPTIGSILNGHRASPEMQPEHELEGLHRRPNGHRCRNRLLHRWSGVRF